MLLLAFIRESIPRRPAGADDEGHRPPSARRRRVGPRIVGSRPREAGRVRRTLPHVTVLTRKLLLQGVMNAAISQNSGHEARAGKGCSRLQGRAYMAVPRAIIADDAVAG